MAVVEQIHEPRTDSVATPVTVVFVGSVLALLEGVYDMLTASQYAGVFDGIAVTTTEVMVFTAAGMLLVVAMLYVAFTRRHRPSSRTYLVLGGLSVLVLVVGVFFAIAIAFIGAVIGIWDVRRAPVR